MTQKNYCLFIGLLFCLLCNDFLFAYTSNKATVGVLTVNIEKPDVMRKLNEPLKIKTIFKNNDNIPLNVKLTYSTIETIEFIEAENDKKKLIQTIEVQAKSETTINIAVVGRTGTLSVHYPIYLIAEWEMEGVPSKAVVVQPFESTITPNPNWQTNNPQHGQLIENVTDLIQNTIPANNGLTFAEQQSVLLKECTETMKTGKKISERTKTFPLDGGLRAVVTFGEYGFIDGKIAIGSPEKFVVYDGIKVSVKENQFTVFPTILAAEKWMPTDNQTTDETQIGKHIEKCTEKYTWTQNISIGNEKSVMKYSLWKNGAAIQFSVDCSEPAWISSVELGAANVVAERVYFGHGYCVVKPKKRFVINANGTRLSTSHVGFEYPSGIAVLQASTTPPVNLTVDPEQKIATIVTCSGTIMTLLPGINGMFDCAIRYRPLNPKKAAAGVKTKAGRFCFDIWGGSFKRHHEIIDHAIRYGLTDSLFIVHSWQRYGYDNRLPDIWPPHSGTGTLAEMQDALKKCDEAGILYGLHDNYIDFYPDAEGYNIDLLSFERHGQPRKAWLNSSIDARSYQFRPDKFKQFLKRNIGLMTPELPQTCYFVDVFSSEPPIDFYDRYGNFHTRNETLHYWCECFDIIREHLTQASRPRQNLSDEKRNEFYAPTISESGNDFLIGHLDGADCGFSYLSKYPGSFHMYIPCEDKERVPWFDAVNHTTFSLHGAGYSNRFENGRGRLLHGIESDNYIATEILTGHPPMVDLGCATRGAVRKYWLLQPILRELADCEIDSVEYVDGDIHQQKIVWKSQDGQRTTIVYVNRSENDWILPEVDQFKNVGARCQFILPPYGFLANGSGGTASIFRTEEGGVAEFSLSNSKLYVNSRQQTIEKLLPIRVRLKQNSFRYLGDNRFQCEISWTAKLPAPLDYSIFVHLVSADGKTSNNKNEGIKAVYGVHKPKPVTEWDDEIVTPMIPAGIANDIPAGKYRLLVGMYDSQGNGHRVRLISNDNDNCRYCIGVLNIVRGTDGNISDLTLEEEQVLKGIDAELQNRLMPPKNPILYGNLLTRGAFLLEGNTLTPLPDEPATEVSVLIPDADKIKVVAIDSNDKKIRDVPSVFKDGFLIFTTEKGEFQYVIE
ncbi:MAG: hypothetical protein LBP87_09820 [Planctomycetaceae bacterium]|jgi:hypothetical protein|nr:hypothetical protein [Planctomycetaceae bacterium]